MQTINKIISSSLRIFLNGYKLLKFITIKIKNGIVGLYHIIYSKIFTIKSEQYPVEIISSYVNDIKHPINVVDELKGIFIEPALLNILSKFYACPQRVLIEDFCKISSGEIISVSTSNVIMDQFCNIAFQNNNIEKIKMGNLDYILSKNISLYHTNNNSIYDFDNHKIYKNITEQRPGYIHEIILDDNLIIYKCSANLYRIFDVYGGCILEVITVESTSQDNITVMYFIEKKLYKYYIKTPRYFYECDKIRQKRDINGKIRIELDNVGSMNIEQFDKSFVKFW